MVSSTNRHIAIPAISCNLEKSNIIAYQIITYVCRLCFLQTNVRYSSPIVWSHKVVRISVGLLPQVFPSFIAETRCSLVFFSSSGIKWDTQLEQISFTVCFWRHTFITFKNRLQLQWTSQLSYGRLNSTHFIWSTRSSAYVPLCWNIIICQLFRNENVL